MIVERFFPGALIAVCGVLLWVPPAPGLIRQNRQMTRSSAAATYYNRGNQRIRAGDLEGAIKDFDVALTFDPTFAAAYNNRGVALFLRVDVDGAMVDYSRAIQLDAQYAEAYSNRANAFHDKADYYRALSDFDRALQLNPRYAPAYFGRGYAKAAVGRTLDAITDFTKVVRIESRNAKAFVNRAILRFLRGDLSGAADDCRRAISIRPDTEAFYVRGRIRQNQGLLDEAIEDYSRAITADQNNAMAFAHLGFALLAKGRTDDAQRNFNRVTQIDPRLGREIDPRMISEGLALTKSSIRSPIPKPASK